MNKYPIGTSLTMGFGDPIPQLPDDSVQPPKSQNPKPSQLPNTTQPDSKCKGCNYEAEYNEPWEHHTCDKVVKSQPDSPVEPELFVPVRNYEGLYEVSNLGNVRSVSRGRNTGRLLKPFGRQIKINYQSVTLCKNGIKKTRTIHRLVAEAFISNLDGKKTVNHKDNNPRNNIVTNLEWASYQENIRHAFANGKVVWNKGRLGLKANQPREAALRQQRGE